MEEALEFWIRYAKTLEARAAPLLRERASLRRGLDTVEALLERGDLTGMRAVVAAVREEQRTIEDGWLTTRHEDSSLRGEGSSGRASPAWTSSP